MQRHCATGILSLYARSLYARSANQPVDVFIVVSAYLTLKNSIGPVSHDHKNLFSTTFFILLFVPEIRVCTCRISLCFVWLENDILPYISASGTSALTRPSAGPPGGREPCRGEVEVHQCTMGQPLLPLGPERESAVTFGQAGRRLWPLPSLPERVLRSPGWRNDSYADKWEGRGWFQLRKNQTRWSISRGLPWKRCCGSSSQT